MVVKLTLDHSTIVRLFESRVILDGSQTWADYRYKPNRFESRVILDGSQTMFKKISQIFMFESRVILDGSQTQTV